MSKPPLRAVKAGEQPTEPASEPVKGPVELAAVSGEQRPVLVAMIAKLARTLDETTSARDVAALTKRIDELIDKVRSIDARAADGGGGEEADDDESTADEPWDASAV